MPRDSGWGALNPLTRYAIRKDVTGPLTLYGLQHYCPAFVSKRSGNSCNINLLPSSDGEPNSLTSHVTWTNRLNQTMNFLPCLGCNPIWILAPHSSVCLVVPRELFVQRSRRSVLHNYAPCQNKCEKKIGLAAEPSGYHVANVQARSSR